MTYNNTNLSN